MTTRRISTRLTVVSSNPSFRDSAATSGIDDKTHSWDTELLSELADDDLLAFATGALDPQSEKRVRERLGVDLRYRAALHEISKRLNRHVDFVPQIHAIEKSDSTESAPSQRLFVDWRRLRLRLRSRFPEGHFGRGTIGKSSGWCSAGQMLSHHFDQLTFVANFSGDGSRDLRIQLIPTTISTETADVFIRSRNGESLYMQIDPHKYFSINKADDPEAIDIFLSDRRYRIWVVDLHAEVKSEISRPNIVSVAFD